jgi:Neuraminidase (sialidase)
MHRKSLRFALVLAGVVSSTRAADVAPGQPVHVTAADGPDRGAKQPQAAVDEAGRIYIAFGQEGTVRLAVSTDRGRTFEVSTVGKVNSLSLGMRRGPRVVATGDAVVVTAIGGRTGKGQDGDVLSWRSTDLGKTWTGPTRVNAVEGSAREGLHGMAAAPGGKIFCTWLDLRDNRTEIFGASSKDGGATWEKDALVYRSPEKSVCECCHPSAAFGPDGTLHVMWRNSLKGARDLYLARRRSSAEAPGR